MKHALQKITTIVVICLFTFFSGCQNDDFLVKENEKSHSYEPKLVTTDDVLSVLKNEGIKDRITLLTQESLQKNLNENESLEYFEKLELYDYTQYTLFVSKKQDDRNKFNFLFYVVTIDRDNVEKSCFLNYITEDDSEGINMRTFTGTMQLFTDEMYQHGEVEFDNGTITANSFTSSGLGTTDCVTTIVVVTHTCTHGGNHSPGESCEPPFQNDAYYSLHSFTDCTTTYNYSTPGNFVGGGNNGGGGSVSNTERFYNYRLNSNQRTFLDSNQNIKNAIYKYINRTAGIATAESLVDIAMVNPGLTLNLLSFIDSKDYTLNSNRIVSFLAAYVTNDDNITPEKINNATELLNLVIQEYYSEDTYDFFQMTIIALNGNYFNQPFDAQYYNAIDNYTLEDLNSTNWPAWQAYFAVQCAIIKSQHPEYSTLMVYYEATKEMVHIALDIVGLVPAFGEVADLANGIIYTIEGDGVNASLSFAATAPVAGWAAIGTKYARKVVQITSTTKTTLHWTKVSTNITFGKSNQLRKVLNLTSTSMQAHHIIPWALSNHYAVQKAASKRINAFHMNEALNGIPLDNSIHMGSHPAYSNRVTSRLNQISPNATPEQAYEEVMDLVNDIRAAILANPNTHINNLIF